MLICFYIFIYLQHYCGICRLFSSLRLQMGKQFAYMNLINISLQIHLLALQHLNVLDFAVTSFAQYSADIFSFKFVGRFALTCFFSAVG